MGKICLGCERGVPALLSMLAPPFATLVMNGLDGLLPAAAAAAAAAAATNCWLFSKVVSGWLG